VQSARRFRYIVRPCLGQWEVTFGDGGSRFLYATETEAVEVARRACRLHWDAHKAPCEVFLDKPGCVSEVVACYDTDG